MYLFVMYISLRFQEQVNYTTKCFGFGIHLHFISLGLASTLLLKLTNISTPHRNALIVSILVFALSTPGFYFNLSNSNFIVYLFLSRIAQGIVAGVCGKWNPCRTIYFLESLVVVLLTSSLLRWYFCNARSGNLQICTFTKATQSYRRTFWRAQSSIDLLLTPIYCI